MLPFEFFEFEATVRAESPGATPQRAESPGATPQRAESPGATPQRSLGSRGAATAS